MPWAHVLSEDREIPGMGFKISSKGFKFLNDFPQKVSEYGHLTLLLECDTTTKGICISR